MKSPPVTSPPATPPHAKKLLVVYHSMTGGTAQMVEALAQACQTVDGIEINLQLASNATAADLLAADGYVFATPENLGSMSGLMKDFFDRTYYPALDQIQGRPYAQMICAGSDGHGAAKQIDRIVVGWRLKPIQEALIINVNAQTPEAILAAKTLTAEQRQACQDLGLLLATGLSMSVF